MIVEGGPIRILCKEIDFHFVSSMEDPRLLVNFVKVLVDNIQVMRDMQAAIAHMTNNPPSDDSGVVLTHVKVMLCATEVDELIRAAAGAHDFIHSVYSDEAYPADHLIDMLSSCVSAIRFGLENPCRSRHAAAAAGHVWDQKYGVKLHDHLTPRWCHEWIATQLQIALTMLAIDRDREVRS